MIEIIKVIRFTTIMVMIGVFINFIQVEYSTLFSSRVPIRMPDVGLVRLITPWVAAKTIIMISGGKPIR